MKACKVCGSTDSNGDACYVCGVRHDATVVYEDTDSVATIPPAYDSDTDLEYNARGISTRPPRRVSPTRISTRGKLLAMGISSRGPVVAGDTATITSRAQIPFRPMGFMIPRDADSFLVNGIYIGQQVAIQVSSDPLPGELFSVSIDDVDTIFAEMASGKTVEIKVSRPATLLHGREYKFPPMNAGTDFVVTVTNMTAYPTTFRAVVIGTDW